jgi:hypothetical protein
VEENVAVEEKLEPRRTYTRGLSAYTVGYGKRTPA